MTLVQRMLPVVSAATNSLRQSDGEVSPGYSDAKLMHYANLDTDHPYKQACVTYYRVVFPERVHWMTMEFDPRSGFAQNEDKIADLLIPRKNISSSPSSNKDTVDTAMIEVTFEDIYNGFQLPCPAGLVLLPGWCHISDNINNVFFSLPQVMKFTLLSTQTQSTRREIKTIILVSSARSLDTNVLMTSKR